MADGYEPSPLSVEDRQRQPRLIFSHRSSQPDKPMPVWSDTPFVPPSSWQRAKEKWKRR